MDHNRSRSVEGELAKVARHRMARRPDCKMETIAAAGEGRREDFNDRFYQSTLIQTEGEYVGRRHWNRGAAPSFERADDFVSTIAKDSGECPPFAFDVDTGDELVVPPNLPTCSIRDCRCDRKVQDIARRDRVARRLRSDSQADLIIGADIGLAIFDAIEIDYCSSVLLQGRLKPRPRQQLGRFIWRRQKGRDEVLSVEVADGQRTFCSIAKDATL